VDKRTAQLRDEIETSPSDWEKEKLKERLAKLSDGVAAIKARREFIPPRIGRRQFTQDENDFCSTPETVRFEP